MVRTLRALLAVLVLTSTAVAQEKKRVAVLDFDYGTVRSAVQAYFGTIRTWGRAFPSPRAKARSRRQILRR